MTVPELQARRAIRLLAGALCAWGIAACGTATGPTGTALPATPSAGAAARAGHLRIPSGDWLQFGDGAQHSGAGPAATGITARTVHDLAQRTVRIDGIADSAAIELHAVRVRGRRRDVIVVTTSYGRTIALDARSGRRLWEYRPRGVDSTPGNPQVTTASPAADPDRRYVYSASPDGVVHKLTLARGRTVWSTPVTFDPRHEKIASALTVAGRWLVVVTGGYDGDIPPYDGHVVTISRATGRIAHVWNAECSDRRTLIRASTCGVTNTQGDDAMWSRAGAVIEPRSGRILVATGNGPFNGSTNWGDSVLELSSDASELLHNWTPTNQAALNAGDADVGSTSPALLPTAHGGLLAVQGGKAGALDLLNIRRLNGTTGGAGRQLGGQLAETASPGGGQVFSQPAVWTHRGTRYIFVGSDSGTGAYRLVDSPHPHLQSVWQRSWPSTSPVVAGGLLYTYDPQGTLYIQSPETGRVLRAVSVPGGHWNSPIVVGGRIILPTGNYHDSASTSAVEILHLPGR